MPLGLELAGSLLLDSSLNDIYNKLKGENIHHILHGSNIYKYLNIHWDYLDSETQIFAYLLSLFDVAIVNKLNFTLKRL